MIYICQRNRLKTSILAVANIVSERDLKTYKNKGAIDSKTLPNMKNILYTEALFDTMALCTTVDEIMRSDTNGAITYLDYSSSKSGVGSYVVQSLTINVVQRSLPTLDIFTESRESLKDLEITALQILSDSSGHMYSKEDIFQKV